MEGEVATRDNSVMETPTRLPVTTRAVKPAFKSPHLNQIFKGRRLCRWKFLGNSSGVHSQIHSIAPRDQPLLLLGLCIDHQPEGEDRMVISILGANTCQNFL